MKCRCERGYAALTLLVVMLSAGGGLMSIAAVNKHSGDRLNTMSVQDQHGLVDARQSLLSYATIYPYLYGPGGAGPAHLPCPDTDGNQVNGFAHQSGNNQRRDGPDPPCTSLSGSAGRLPRHIALPDHRYVFHSESWQRYQYHVAGSVINNPLNRVVNLQRLREMAHQPVVTLQLPSSSKVKTIASVSITGKALINATVAYVAAWVIERSENTRQTQCVLSGREPMAGVPADLIAGDTCHPPQLTGPECENDQPLMLVIDRPAVLSSTCLSDSLDANTIEGVPALRHWFVRNEWHLSIASPERDKCDPDVSSPAVCALRFSPQSQNIRNSGTGLIELYWDISA